VKDGVYKRGAGARHNQREAQKVAELVKMHLLNNPELSLGIVAFSLSQRKAIEAQIDLIRKENPEFNVLFENEQDEPVFIKNLENVQGDERDVIILSVGYGKDETGKMTMNFGPINRSGGARRLNVAVTRARYALKLVTSIEPEDIDLTKTEAQGAALLRNYLEVARDGVKAVFKDDKISADAEFESPFEESVFKILTERGVHLVPQVGVSKYRIDFAVFEPDQPGRYILGIECDGTMYHSALTARDRDRLRQQILEGLGWKIHRIWSREWIQNREGEIKKVLDAIESSKQMILSGESQTKKKINHSYETNIQSQFLDISTIPTQTINIPNGSIPYVRKKLMRQSPTGGYALLNTPIRRLISAFKAIVDAEGPISIKTAKYRILEAWDAKKGSRIDSYLNFAINQATYQNIIVQRGSFLWPIGMKAPPFRIHAQGKEIRSIEEISPEEITIAIIECVKCAVGIMSEELIRETLRLFGLKSTRENTQSINEVINGLLRKKILISEDEKIVMDK
jgi:very-short-patch-repair endonuclease